MARERPNEEDPVAAALRRLGRAPGADSLAALEALLADDPKTAGPALDALLPELARARAPGESARLELAVATVYLARGEAAQAKDLLADLVAKPQLAADLRARGNVALARAEAALDDRKGARARIVRSAGEMLVCDPALDSLAALLRALGDPVAGAAVDALRVERRRAATTERAGARVELLARLLHALGSSLSATAEPLHAILRAVLDETGGDRGALMVYEGSTLRFALGLARDGSVLGEDRFVHSTTVVASALEASRPVLVPDLAARLPFAAATSANELGLRSALCLPLHVGRKLPGAPPDPAPVAAVRGIAGVLYVDSTVAASFRDEDAPFFEALADAAGVALRAARTAGALRQLQREAPAQRPARGQKPQGAPETVAVANEYEGIVTRDPAFRRVLALLDRVVGTESNVLIRGESGTGKELVARALHRLGRRAKGPFVAVDCGAIPDELVAEELFGHEAGAFTGATDARPGLFERAHGGTLFLDEVGEMSPALQASLLRALQEGEVRRLGASRARPVSVRVLAATHRDLRTLVETGEFRHDLFFRLAVVEVRLPPLRERPADVALLVEHFLARIVARAGGRPLAIEPPALARLEEHGWPGNVRELENVLENLALHADGAITLPAVDAVLAGSPTTPPGVAPAPPLAATFDGTLDELERRAIEERLERFAWNQVQAAASLGIDRRTLYRKIRRFGLGSAGT